MIGGAAVFPNLDEEDGGNYELSRRFAHDGQFIRTRR